MTIRILVLFATALVSLFAEQLNADVYVTYESDEYHKGGGRSERINRHALSSTTTWIIKEIGKQDYVELREIATDIPSDVTWDLRVNSLGGDVNTALKIGRLLRKHNARVIVDVDAACASACVFILAGAVDRGINLQGKVGIHRPYDPNDQATTREGQEKKQKILEQKIKYFLSDMNISELLYDAMLRVSPGNIKMLSREELDQYGLGQNDPYWDDAQEAQEAMNYGMSRGEYLKKRASAKEICGQYFDSGQITSEQYLDKKCDDNVLRGLPPTYKLGND